MIKTITNKKITCLFNIIAITILIGSLSIYNKFEKVNDIVEDVNLQSNIEYIDNMTSNISDLIKKSTSNNIYKSLKNSDNLKENLEQNLQFLITNRY
jgi:hypothetical protein